LSNLNQHANIHQTISRVFFNSIHTYSYEADAMAVVFNQCAERTCNQSGCCRRVCEENRTTLGWRGRTVDRRRKIKLRHLSAAQPRITPHVS